MPRIRVVDRATGQTGTVEDWDFDPGKFERLDTQIGQTPQSGGFEGLLPTILGIGGGLAGIPLGPAGIVGGGAIGSGLGAVLKQAISGKGADLGEIAGETAFGAVGGFLGKGAKLAKGAAEVAEGASKVGRVAKLGRSLQRSVIQPTAKVGPRMETEKQEILNLAKKYSSPLDNPQTLREKIATNYDDLNKEIKNRLPTITGTVARTDLDRAVATKAEDVFISNPDFKNNLRELLARVKPSAGKRYKAADIQDAISRLDKSEGLDRAYKKILNGQALTDAEEAALTVRGALSDVMAESFPQIKELTLRMSELWKLSKGMGSKGVPFSPLGLPLGNILGSPLQSLAYGAGRGLENIGDLPPALSSALKLSATQSVPRAVLGGSGASALAEEQLPTDLLAEETVTEESPVSGFPPELAVALLAQFPEKAGVIQAMYKISQEAEGGNLDAASRKKLGQLDQAESILDTFAGKLGELGLEEFGPAARVSGFQRGLAGRAGLDPKAEAFRKARVGARVMLARAMGEVGNLSEPEQQAALDLIPDIGMSRAEVTENLSILKTLLNRMRADVSGQGAATNPLEEILSLSGGF